ncbi:Cytochrome P450 71C2 [Hordeum vulgare]|nr:Cytochrome P450 71C2 [Hordeum vulgare]
MAKLQAEVRGCATEGKEMVTVDDLGSMSCLKVVMREAMRLHLSGPLMIPHLSTVDCDVEGHTVPSGMRVIINVWAIGRDVVSWKDTEEFVPERFMEEAMDAACDLMRNDFCFLPFRCGRRMCPGVSFAAITFEIILANLIYHFD